MPWSFISEITSSKLIEHSLLVAIQIVGFILGYVILNAIISRFNFKAALYISIFGGAAGIWALIALFESLKLTSWSLVGRSWLVRTVCGIPLIILAITVITRIYSAYKSPPKV